MPDTKNIKLSFENFILDSNFPCVGAKVAQAHNTLEFCVAGGIQSSNHDQLITESLQSFAQRLKNDDLYQSFVVLFPYSPKINETEFEKALWQRLASFHNIDHMNYNWDPNVSDDSSSPDFSMSIGGEAFYIIGLHPHASRKARRFQCPALVFNAHRQFEQLRAEGLYDKIKETIIMRDIAANGSANPMLAVHGTKSEASQYSGRVVGENWKCPFNPHKKHK